MVTFAFDLPTVRFIVEAETEDAAREALEENVPGALLVRSEDQTRSVEIRDWRGDVEEVPICQACTCTDDDPCADGCGWLTEDLCTTDDAQHAAARAKLTEATVGV